MKKDSLFLDDNLITDEFYYDSVDFSKGEKIHLDWFTGLKKVFDVRDEKFNDFEKCVEFCSENQIRMLTLLDTIMDKDAPSNNLVTIFTNYNYNVNGEKNIIEQVAVVYQFTETIFIVARFANYTMTDFAKNYDLSKLNLDEK
ncbi:MAG: hypothetical protein ACRCRZ_00035 [Metamycoplasmataceae bacterium]